jgi:DNA-binding MarR family transcriptional regulator
MAKRARDELGLASWAMFLRTHAAVVARLERELLEARRLPLAWYDVLLELNAAPGRRLRMQQLGDQVVLSRSRVSRIVDETTAAGLTQREPDPDDRRGYYAVLTEDGRTALRSAAPVYLRGIKQHFTDHLDDDQLRAMHRALTAVLDAQSTTTPPPRRRRGPDRGTSVAR